jgi:Na+/melibiose symporter-like transporter
MIDLGALRGGCRREALYCGMQGTLRKLGLGLAAALFASTLASFCAFIAYVVFVRRDEGGVPERAAS